MGTVNDNDSNQNTNQTALSEEGDSNPADDVKMSENDAPDAEPSLSEKPADSMQESGDSMDSVMNLYEESFQRFAEGEVVTGRIISVDKEHVLVDIGYKSEGQIRIQEFKDEDGNVCQGDVLLEDTKNSLIRSEDMLVAAVGLTDTLVVETSDAIVVAPLSRSQEIKKIMSAYTKQWCPRKKAETLAIAEYDRFLKESEEMFELILERIQNETEKLYPLIRELSSKTEQTG